MFNVLTCLENKTLNLLFHYEACLTMEYCVCSACHSYTVINTYSVLRRHTADVR